jgi:hypothetical protein
MERIPVVVVGAGQAGLATSRWEAAEADVRPMIARMLTEPNAYLVVSGAKLG